MFSVTDTALQLHYLDYNLPENIMTLILRQNQITNNVIQIDELVKMYNEIINKMDDPVVSIIKRRFSLFYNS